MRALLAALLLLGAPLVRAAAPALAVLPLSGEAEGAARASVEERVRLAAGRYAAVQDAATTRQALASAGTLGLACDPAEAACAQQMAGLAGAARVLFGLLDESGTLTLQLAEVTGAPSAAARWRETLPPAGVARDAAVERAVLTLLAPERVTARLQLEVAPRGARIVVDDIFRGPAPLSTALLLSPGAHRISVTFPGYLLDERSVQLEVGTATRLRIELARDPDAPAVEPATASAAAEDAEARDRPEVLTVAVFPCAAGSMPARVGRALDEALAAELGRRDALLIIGPREVEQTLAAARPDCALADPCAAEVARVLGAEAFVTARLETSAHAITLRLQRVESASAAVVQASRASSLSDNQRRLLYELPDAAGQLFPELDVEQGRAPIDLDYFDERMTSGGLPPWAFWTAAGTGGVLALATGVAGVVALTAEQPMDAGRAGALFAVGAGGTVVALGAAGVLGLLVDWDAR